MADGDMVKMELTFWRGDKRPGDVIEVPADEVHRWQGFAKPVATPDPADVPGPSGAPADSASAADWRAYAVSLGMEKAKADKATKQELQDFATKATAGATA
ncbi:hypothetical protein [Streptomyces sp. NPDC056105]|uniref:hypothetical protein n=1 Tax=Streptomyces sp. NPDC056105 TaxID=3345714 RepID=UPI0035DC3F4C